MSEEIRQNEIITEKIKNIEPTRMRIEDIPQIADIFISYWGTMCLYEDYVFEGIIRQNLSYVYKIDDEIIAFCLVEYKYATDTIVISLLCVKKEYKGNHLGKNLLSFCINNCNELELNNFALHVSTTNTPALKLYTKLGFVITDFIKHYYRDEAPEDSDAYLMTLNM